MARRSTVASGWACSLRAVFMSLSRAGGDGVLDEFLDRRGRALDDFAGGDAVDQDRRQLADGHASYCALPPPDSPASARASSRTPAAAAIARVASRRPASPAPCGRLRWRAR